MINKTNIKCSISQIPNGIDFLRDTLQECKIDKKEKIKLLLSAEEALGTLIKHSSEDENIAIKVYTVGKSAELHISCRGEKFDVSEIGSSLVYDDDPEANEIIKRLSENVLGKNIMVKSSGGINTVYIKSSKTASRSKLVFTLSMLVFGVIAGLIMKELLPSGVNDFAVKNIFAPVNTMFLNALKMVVAPLVFFSIASSIADFDDIRSLGRVAVKMMIGYVLTSAAAIAIGLGVYFLFPVGAPALKAAVTDAAAATVEKGQNFNASLIDTLVGIIPTNIIDPFQKSDMLQIIFMSVLAGIAISALSKKISVLKTILTELYTVFSKITTMIVSVMPIVIFCSMAKMVIGIDTQTLLSVFSWIPVTYAAGIVMLGFYALILLTVGGLDPIKFFKKFNPAMITAFTFASSNPVIPTSMEICDKKLGISKSLYSFSIPLGATVNMDGGCITQIITVMFMAKVFGVPVTLATVLPLYFSILILSVGSPGVPGGTLVCISMLLPQLGIPSEAISIIMGLYSIVGMMLACINVTGDGVVTTIIAKKENLIDLEVYNS